ncbi:unnamed protein product [Schistocephalus solidus]|uniref:Protein C10 n=1 Tax=Schistocephalus solidus TaxID=70667 RepID=A0A183SHI1_SCHSO|nr:unnamed protein product [Schistocephalus solidus]
MSISTEQVISIIQQQQAGFKTVHSKMMEYMMEQFSLHFADPEYSSKLSKSAGAVAEAEEPQEFPSIKTHRGLFQFTRLPPSLTPAIFQHTMENKLTGIERALSI